MASITAGTLRAGKKARDKQGSDQHLSKVVELNGKYRLFFRTIDIPEYDEDGNEIGLSGMKDIAVAVVPGRSLDYIVCGASFISYSENMYKSDESGNLQDLTGLQSWARIARVLHSAQCLREKKNLENEAKRAAEELGKPIDQVKLAQAIEAVELKYNGGKAADGTKIPPKESPSISGIQQKMTTQLLVVKLLPNGEPDFANAQYAVLEISNQRMNELIALADKPEYFNNDLDYFEVGYDYIGASKQEAGKGAKFQGIAETLSLKAQYPELWEKLGRNLVNGLAKGKTIQETAEIIRSRNRNLKATHTPTEIISAFKKWCANNAAVFGSIDYEDETTQRAATDFLTSNLLDGIPNIKAKFEALVAEQKKEEGDEPAAVAEQAESTPVQEPVPAQTAEPTFEESEQKGLADTAAVLQAGQAGQTLSQLAANVPDIDLGDGDMGDLD